MKKLKDVLIVEYRYSILIKNLPNHLKRDKILEIAQRILRNKISYSYVMILSDYKVNPYIIYNDKDYKLYKDCNNSFEIEQIDIIVDYKDIIIDERFNYIFNTK